MAHVVLADLTKRYGAALAVDCLNLEVQSGELMALLGPSGCGKTTTLRMVAGLLAPSSGDIRFDGVPVARVPAERRGAVMVFQKHLLFPHMTVGENVAFGLKMRGVDRATIRRRVEELLELVQLGGYAARRSHELSGGQQQRVALARALIVEPKVLLLDEPLANLDANLRLEMRKLIRTAQQTLGMTTLFVTHDQEEAVMLADRVALMMDGRLLQAGCPRTLYERPASAAVARFFRNENRLPGIKRGTRVETPLGEIVLAGSPLPDGPVRVTVRPEHVQRLTPGKHGDDCPNTLVGQVLNTVYMGAHVQAQVAFDRWTWTVHLPPEQDIAVGAPCVFYMPPERVWLLPDSV